MRRYSEYMSILKEMDVSVTGFRWSGKHYFAQCRSADGLLFQTAFAKSPSDHRALKNWWSAVRRIVERRLPSGAGR